MLLNLDLIKENLPEKYPAKRYGPRQRELCYRRPMLLEQGKPLEGGMLYIAHVGSLPESMPLSYSEQIKRVCNLERTIRVPYLTALTVLGKNYCTNVYMADHFVGCIAIGAETENFREGAYPLMDRVMGYLQKGYIKHLRLSTQVEKPGLEALRKLLDRAGVSDRELEALQGEGGCQWLLFVLRERLEEQSYPREYMRASLNAISPDGVYAVIHWESLTGLIRCPTREDAPALVDQFSDLASRMGYLVGLSNPFSQLWQLYTYLPQAVFAANKAQEQGLSLCHFESCTLDYLLDSCLGDMTLDALLGPGLRRLQHHDETRGTQYLKTLNVYLQEEMSIVHTAQALFIHRSSLLKRLDIIQRLLEDDLRNPRKRLYYRICLELMAL